MKRAHYVPNSITAFSLMCGLFVIFRTNMIEVGGSTFDSLQKSVILLLAAGFADFMDGLVARAFRVESTFGGVFDSLADAVTFGVAPSVVMLKSLSLEPGTDLSFLAATGAMVYSVCGVLRLVRFTSHQRTLTPEEPKEKHFTGLPIPAAAGAATSINLFLASEHVQGTVFAAGDLRAVILSLIMILLGYFMVSRWKFPSAKALEFRLPTFSRLFLSVLVAVLLFFGLIYHFALLYLSLTWLYVTLAFVLSVTRLCIGKQSKTLADFEPAEDSLEKS